MNKYYDTIKANKAELVKMVEAILAQSGNKLLFKLGEQNILNNPDNCIESSTAIGYAVEEFLVSALETYHKEFPESLHIHRSLGSTTIGSYDCFFVADGVKFLVNIKAQKKNGANNAVAAIKQLKGDYCDSEPESEKSFMILKANYQISEYYIEPGDNERCIEVTGIDAYCLEEFEMKGEQGGFMQDNRNWRASAGNYNNGRLQLPRKFRKEHKMEESLVSYERTRKMITDIFNYNEDRSKSGQQ